MIIRYLDSWGRSWTLNRRALKGTLISPVIGVLVEPLAQSQFPWVLVKGFNTNTSYHIMEAILFAIDPHYGKLT